MRPAIQLYSLRDLDEPLSMTLRRVREAGFEGVEFANRLTDENAADVADELDDSNLEALAAHVGWSDLTGSDLDDLLPKYETVGCDTLVVPHVSFRRFMTEGDVAQFADELVDLQERLDDRGFGLWYHNQDHEFTPVASGWKASAIDSADRFPGPAATMATKFYRKFARDRRVTDTGFGALVRAVAPSGIGFEVDTGHVSKTGFDPISAIGCVDELGGQVGAVHVTDDTVAYANEQGLEPGSLVKRIDSVAGKNGAEWLVYEEDHPDTPIGALRRAEALLVDRAATLDAVSY